MLITTLRADFKNGNESTNCFAENIHVRSWVGRSVVSCTNCCCIFKYEKHFVALIYLEDWYDEDFDETAVSEASLVFNSYSESRIIAHYKYYLQQLFCAFAHDCSF